MRRSLRHVFWLGWKELLTLSRSPALILCILYALTLQVYATGQGISLEVRNAAVAVVDEDLSPLSRAIVDALGPPYFQAPEEVSARRAGALLDAGSHSFVLHVPPRFESDLLKGRRARLKLDVDGTVVSQAYLGASYVEAVVAQEVRRRTGAAAPLSGAQVRVRFNPGRQSRWQVGVMELGFMITLLAAVLPAAALLREREHGTIEQMLSMPLHPVELILGKAWAYILVILVISALSLDLVVEGALGAPVRGSRVLLLVATVVYLFAMTGVGMALATVARTVAQVGLLSLLTLMPMMFLSGVWTPLESMPEGIRWISSFLPLHYYMSVCYAVIFRGAELETVARDLALLAAMGAMAVTAGALRFRSHFAVPEG